MNFYLYVAVIILDVSFVRFLWDRQNVFYSCVHFCSFLPVIFVYNICHLMSQMTLTKNNMKNLGLNSVQMVRSVPNLVDCRVD